MALLPQSTASGSNERGGASAGTQGTDFDSFGRTVQSRVGSPSAALSTTDMQYEPCACLPAGKLKRVSRAPLAPADGRGRAAVEVGHPRLFQLPRTAGNLVGLNSFRLQAISRRSRAIRWRSRRDRMPWERSWLLVSGWIPRAKILHPHLNVRFDSRQLREEPHAVGRHLRICAGASSNRLPYRDGSPSTPRFLPQAADYAPPSRLAPVGLIVTDVQLKPIAKSSRQARAAYLHLANSAY